MDSPLHHCFEMLGAFFWIQMIHIIIYTYNHLFTYSYFHTLYGFGFSNQNSPLLST